MPDQPIGIADSFDTSSGEPGRSPAYPRTSTRHWPQVDEPLEELTTQEAREQREPFFEGDEEVQGNGKQEHPVGMVRVAGLGWAANLRDPHQVPLLSRCRCFAAMGSAAMGARV